MANEEPVSIEGLITQYLRESVHNFGANNDVKESQAGCAILELAPADQIRVIQALFQRMEGFRLPDQSVFNLLALSRLLSALLRKALEIDAAGMTDLVTRSTGRMEGYFFPTQGFLRAVEKWSKANAMTPPLRAALEGIQLRMRGRARRKKETSMKLLDKLLGRDKAPDTVHIELGEAWSDAAIAELASMPPETRGAWVRMLDLARSANGSKPTKKYVAAAKAIIDEIGNERFAQSVSGWFPLLAQPRTQLKPLPTGPAAPYTPNPNLLLADGNANLLKGIAWACANCSEERVARSLADAASACFKKIPAHGPRNAKVGNAVLAALGLMQCAEAAAQLSRLAAQVKQPTGKKMIGKALTGVAARTGQTEEDLAELAMPTFGLGAGGVLRRGVGTFTAEIAVTGSVDAELRWIKSDGKTQKGVPAEIKRDHAAELKELARTVKDIEKMLPAQRARIERLLMSQRQWTFEQWRQRFVDHPLLANLSRRLIWKFQNVDGSRNASGIFFSDRLVTADDASIDWLANGSIVRPWHPIDATTDEIVAWRQWLTRHQVMQPFKQAHREIYLLTDAERTTETYSNRFAGHIVRQHQFVALCQQREWKTKLQGMWDGGDTTPRLEIGGWGLAAEFWAEMVETRDGDRAEAAAESGVALYLSTDQVRFYRSQGPQPRVSTQEFMRRLTERDFDNNREDPLPLEQIPPLVFSEVMRDADLFVGVASVGNDPGWRDGGPAGRFGAYWQSYSFGELTESAKTRREVLERLVPPLKIADRCSLSEKYLVVRGDIRTYKIHLGSGNILMEPNDRYLCIVPDRREADHKVFLPFEGDATLTIILSKAFLLAEDSKISDATILRQIQ